MAAAACFSLIDVTLPGILRPIRNDDLVESFFTYNGLPTINDQRNALQMNQYATEIQDLWDIIERYQLSGVFGVHSAHRHDLLPEGTVRFETELDKNERDITWTRSIAIQDLPTMNMHPIFFKVDESSRLVPVEYASGAAPASDKEIPLEFVSKFSSYIAENKLHDIFFLQVIHPRKNVERRVEIEVGWNNIDFTVCMPISARAKPHEQNMVRTGWLSNPGNPNSPADGEHHEEIVVGPRKGTHKVVTTSLLPLTEETVMQKLAEIGII